MDTSSRKPPSVRRCATLATGAQMPLVGLGTWKSTGPGEVETAVHAALMAGYRHIDCAACYGNEAEVGKVFGEVFGKSLVPRSEVFVTSKLWNSEHSPDHVLAACKQTLQDLQLEYLDLYLVHWPQAFEHVDGSNRGFPKNPDGSIRYDLTTSLRETWEAMERLVDAGLCRAIGLSNFNPDQFRKICSEARIKPAVLQVEVHPFFAQTELVREAEAEGMVVTAYSPLGSGAAISGVKIFEHPTLVRIGRSKGGRSAAQVAIAYLRQRGISVIPKSSNPDRVRQNFDVFFELSEADMAEILALDANKRTGWGGPLVERDGAMRPRDEVHPDYPFVRDDPSSS